MAGTNQADAANEVLHQRRTMPKCPLKLAVGGVMFAAVIGYLTLYTKKKPEASAVDVAKVTAGIAGPENTHPRK
ncbi:hypothetical protein CDL15_Pgr021106 [Punica granatum]|uniref:Uncharacterized protein n=1 Tax=Punica granatum TaxID=22663 RepID=A0A218WKA4_PUNGR|nr:hypothetical protein CDL15_Pgr021106 [Punica granatum]PKI79405.1 hypothetical protein CRG98_000220 [Punica granatum]